MKKPPLHKLAAITLLLLASALILACGTKPGIIFPALATPLQWPSAPDTPRISYVGQIATSNDLKPGVSGIEAVGQTLFGKKESRSMLTPIAATTDDADRLFVADSNAQCVHVFDMNSRKYAQWTPGKNQAPFSQPVGLAWDPIRSRLLVTDSVAAAIFVFDSSGHFLGRLAENLLHRPVGILVNPEGQILVADVTAHQILFLSPDGQLLKRLGNRGSTLGLFNYPTNLALAPDGTLYVSDSLNFRIQAFDKNLNPLRQIGQKGDMPGCFAQPKGIATDSEGHLYVLDAQFENVQLFDPQGHILMDFGEEGHNPGQFWLPTAIFIDHHDRLWIADSYNRRIQVFDYHKLPTTLPPQEATK